MKWALVVAALAGCTPIPAASYGEQLFNDAQLAGSQFNQTSCATCHSVRATDTRIVPGGSLIDVVTRPSYWGGNELRLIDAASFCYVYFMRGAGPFEPTEPRSRAFYEYLASLGQKADAPAVKLTLTLNTVDVPRGDKTRGEEVYRSACLTCHGDLNTGRGRISELASILPNVASEYGALFPGAAPRLVFIEKVRHGQFFRVGGNMPFFSQETLSDADLGALLTYLGQ